MAELLCPLECINSACPPPDFIERNGTWLLTLVGVGTSFVGALLAYFLKSRCKKVKCLCVQCEREVVQLDAQKIDVATDPVNNNSSPAADSTEGV